MSVTTDSKNIDTTKTHDTINKFNSINFVYITDSLFAHKPIFDQDKKLLTLYADKDIKLKPHEFTYHTSEDIIILSQYIYNFSTTSDFLLRLGISIHVNFIPSKTDHKLIFTLHNLTNFKQRIHSGTELVKVRFVTHRFMRFSLNSNLDYRYYKNDRKAIAEMSDGDSQSGKDKFQASKATREQD